ncbi:MAG: hypothetical protein A2504_13685 [Bdellovibrionales bacterium RIFOXYD12_FULL_39_22]|nr:MAG: hypothetical protein A2385_00410 [Bdellovibrionales bacterium RIFOXYB1_FULL_39_21]OFZ43861.1 MAG: hypothetical protein A2485_05120 [Bdellovibrionales bacterium RIFOXYC12_FULL_39_17]OFZ48805.1 MAG: hypothetical protein A2404_17725 [Bdellovibrionales bacterium RIFOXYC1_FULL_39_130]OFZ69438.1 MAG: hypothetical protein A2451_10855 [Bdellovibrionales bacterium RIFOXYC2_FULL_39_8]OFZ76538.1 MAG: hypothetical protein A2560_06390 [Bdellovibrionales bacterium RIFOXYD1_FULL_39_84]OFZ94772.1 MAG:
MSSKVIKTISFYLLAIIIAAMGKLFAYEPGLGIESCVGCHPTKNYGGNGHGGIAKNCFNCHGKSRFDTPYRYNLNDETNTICYSCHEQFDPAFGTYGNPAGGHPVAKHPVAGGNDMLYPEKEFSCASCHNPHGSPMRDMFRYESRPGEDRCKICHNKILYGNGNRRQPPPWEITDGKVDFKDIPKRPPRVLGKKRLL